MWSFKKVGKEVCPQFYFKFCPYSSDKYMNAKSTTDMSTNCVVCIETIIFCHCYNVIKSQNEWNKFTANVLQGISVFVASYAIVDKSFLLVFFNFVSQIDVIKRPVIYMHLWCWLE